VNTAFTKESEETFIFDRAEAIHRHFREVTLSNQERSNDDLWRYQKKTPQQFELKVSVLVSGLFMYDVKQNLLFQSPQTLNAFKK